MRVLSIMIRSGPVLAALLFAVTASGAETSQRYTLTGSATLSNDAQTLRGDKLSLRGYLQSTEAPSTAAFVQDGGRFTVMAHAVAVAQACYNDTIFRDDFDGDGR